MATTRNTRWSSVEYLLHTVIMISVIESVCSQTTCAGRRCKIQLTEGEAQVVNFPGSVETVIDSLDEIRWTITAKNDRNRILFVIDDINWPKTDLKFEDQNPNSIPIRHEGKVFPIFPEYSTKLIKSGIFLSGTHSMLMEMDIPIVAELLSIPSFHMQFTAFAVKELFRCKLSSTSCETIAAPPWRKSSEGYVYTGSSTVDEGSLTVRLPHGTQLEGKGYLSFGYVFDYKGITSGGLSRDEEGRVTVTCPGKRNFGISPNGATQLIVECDMEDASITFTVRGSLRFFITDVGIHDAAVSMKIIDPEPSADSSVLPVIAGIFVFVGLVVVGIIALSILRRKRSQSADERKPPTTVNKGGRDNSGFRSGSVRNFEDPDDGTYHYPTFPLNPPPKDGDTIYQEIEKKDMKGHATSAPNKKDGSREAGKNAYDFLELPGDGSLDSNKKTRSMERLSIQGSPLLSRCKNRSMGYETLDGTTTSSAAADRERKSPSVTPKTASEKKTKYPKQTPEYLEILSSSELDALKDQQDKNGQPVLAHQDLYQHLQRKDIPFQKPGTAQMAAAEKRSSVGTDITEENYGKLDIATDSPPGGPNYFVLEANTE